jgi:hypothetical protein
MNMRRFSLSLLVLAAAWSALPAWPQQPGRLPKVAILSPAKAADMVWLRYFHAAPFCPAAFSNTAD